MILTVLVLAAAVPLESVASKVTFNLSLSATAAGNTLSTINLADAPAAKGRATSELKTFVEDRKGHDRRYAIDETKARAQIGYVPQHDFENGLRNTLRWYLDNEAWWQPLLAKTA